MFSFGKKKSTPTPPSRALTLFSFEKTKLNPPQLCATIAAEYSTARSRGAFVGAVFAMQGIGILTASLVAICTTAAFKSLILRDINYLDYVWRIELGLGVVPAMLTVYLRNKLPEPPQWTMVSVI